jgi:hypothetical protein
MYTDYNYKIQEIHNVGSGDDENGPKRRWTRRLGH